MDGSSIHRFRLNLNDSVHEPNSLLHARETKTSTLPCGFYIEPLAQIPDDEMNLA